MSDVSRVNQYNINPNYNKPNTTNSTSLPIHTPATITQCTSSVSESTSSKKNYPPPNSAPAPPVSTSAPDTNHAPATDATMKTTHNKLSTPRRDYSCVESVLGRMPIIRTHRVGRSIRWSWWIIRGS
eukprot:scaffold766_cov210-Alexandrium_tamarense.AAC.31